MAKSKLWHVPARLTTGAYILDQGLAKLNPDEQTAAALHGMASTAFPQVADMDPMKFTRLLGRVETAVGSSLLLIPFVPPAIAGAALTAFSSGLVRLYMKMPGARREGSLMPTQQGGSLAKDSWMLSIGLALVLDGLSRRRQSQSTRIDS